MPFILSIFHDDLPELGVVLVKLEKEMQLNEILKLLNF